MPARREPCSSLIPVHPRLAVGAVAVLLLLQLPARPAQPTTLPSTAVIDSIAGLWRVGDRPAAHALLDRTLPAARDQGDTLLWGRLLVLRGQMRTALGESRLGEPALAQGLPLARAAADTTWLLKGMRWYGVALGYNLRNEEAHAVFAEMRQLAMAAGDSVHWAWAEVGLAYQDGRAGRTAAERQGYERAVDLFQHVGDVRGEIFARNGLGTLLMKVADFPAARASYLRTLTVARQVGYTYVEALAENNLGALEFGLGDPGRAEQHFRRAQELHRAEGNVKEALTAAHNVAVCLTWLGDLDSALTGLQQVRATSRREGFAEDEFSAVGQMAAVLRKQGRPGQAVALLDSMMTRPEPVTERNRLKLVQEKAAALELQDHREQARDLLLAAEASLPELGDPLMEAQYLTMLARLLAGTGHPRQALQRMQPLERANLASGLVEGAMLAALESGQAWRRLDRPDSARACLERAAARWRAQRGVPRDPDYRERRGETGRRIFMALAHQCLQEEAAPDRAFALLQEFKARTLFERIVGPQATTVRRLEPVDLARVRALLQPGEVFLDFFLGAEGSLVFAVTRDTTLVGHLPAQDEVVRRAELFRSLLTGTDLSAHAAAVAAQGAQAMGRLLTGPISGSISGPITGPISGPISDGPSGAKTVILCPDGVLNGLPGALLVPEGSLVHRVPSASIFTRLRQGLGREPVPIARVAAAGPGGTGVAPELDQARRELEWLQGRYPSSSVLAPGDPDKEDLSLGGDILHLAGHVRVSDQCPWRSSINLAPEQAGAHSAVLEAAAIAAGRVQARLTVLAGCESASGGYSDGGGVMGLGAAFIAAGSPAVVATLWPVDDAVTFRFMRSFYGGLDQGLSVAAALAAARRELAGDPRFAHPYFWAGYVAMGEGRLTLAMPPVARPRPAWPWLAGGAVLLGAALFSFLASRRDPKGNSL